jgi:hypothetical protein
VVSSKLDVQIGGASVSVYTRVDHSCGSHFFIVVVFYHNKVWEIYIIGSIKSPKTGRKQAAHYFATVLPLMTSSKFKPATVKIGNVPFILNIPQNVYAHIFKDLHIVRTKLHVINFQLPYVWTLKLSLRNDNRVLWDSKAYLGTNDTWFEHYNIGRGQLSNMHDNLPQSIICTNWNLTCRITVSFFAMVNLNQIVNRSASIVSMSDLAICKYRSSVSRTAKVQVINYRLFAPAFMNADTSVWNNNPLGVLRIM